MTPWKPIIASWYTQKVGVLDLLFPKRCVGCRSFGQYLCPHCFSQLSFSTTYVCFVCNRASLDGLTHPICKRAWTIDGIYSSLVYAGVVKRLIYQFKYQPHLTDLKELLTELFYEGIIQHEGLQNAFVPSSIVVPIPLHAIKLRKRGYNQVEVLAKGIGKKTGIDVKNILVRSKKTESQFQLDREKRRVNLQNAFVLQDKYKNEIKNKTIVLVDDVVTSGATLLEAAKILKRGGADKVYGITLAHGQ